MPVFTGQEPVLAGLACGGSNQDWLRVVCPAGIDGTEIVASARNAQAASATVRPALFLYDLSPIGESNAEPDNLVRECLRSIRVALKNLTT